MIIPFFELKHFKCLRCLPGTRNCSQIFVSSHFLEKDNSKKNEKGRINVRDLIPSQWKLARLHFKAEKVKERKTRKWETKDGCMERKTEHQIALILPTTLDSLMIPSSSMTKEKLIANKLDVFTKYSLSNILLGSVLSFGKLCQIIYITP